MGRSGKPARKNEGGKGISRIALTAALIAVVAIAGVAIYVTLTPSSPPDTASTSSSTGSPSAAPLNVTLVPPSLLVAPGQTQNYSLIQVSAAGSGLSGTVTVRVFAPGGLSLILNQTSVPLSETVSIPVVLKAAAGLSPGNYTATVETSSSAVPASNKTFTIEVVPMLVVMRYPSFYPQNITVAKGTRVTWINLNSFIGCCDPGDHDVSFLSGANYTSRLISTLQTVSYAFGTDGVYDYYCTVHPIMKGQVTVTG
jgi:plastocyanin